MMTWNHFVPSSDEMLRQTAQEFGKANKCRVKIDFIPHRDTYVKVAKEQETGKGHDIVFLFFSARVQPRGRPPGRSRAAAVTAAPAATDQEGRCPRWRSAPSPRTATNGSR
jgi:hypothetical protein